MIGQLVVTTPTKKASSKWDTEDAASVAAVREEFDRLVATGNLAYTADGQGNGEKIKTFDEQAQTIMITSPLQGG